MALRTESLNKLLCFCATTPCLTLPSMTSSTICKGLPSLRLPGHANECAWGVVSEVASQTLWHLEGQERVFGSKEACSSWPSNLTNSCVGPRGIRPFILFPPVPQSALRDSPLGLQLSEKAISGEKVRQTETETREERRKGTQGYLPLVLTRPREFQEGVSVRGCE